jgi:DNA (cytosine-5)-methyltransferase 1
MDHDCCDTMKRSRRWHVIERSIFDVSTDEMLEACGVRPGDVDMLIGGPPCQPFSKAGYWARGDSRRLEDPRASTLGAYLRVLEEAKPRAFLLENVEGLAYAGKDEGLQLLLREIERINRRTKSNYQPAVCVLNAAEYGVPQLRERVFVIAARDGSSFRFPSPTHASASEQPSLVGSPLPPFRNGWDALGDLRPSRDEDLDVRGKWADLLPSIPEGQNYLWHTDRGGGEELFGWRTRFWTFMLKLAKHRPSWTIQAQPGPSVGPFHWDNRRLSMREMCRIQTFPDDVTIVGSRSSVQKQVGNAVPSLLGEVLAREIRKQLLSLRLPKGELKLLPPVRTPIPSPTKHTGVPARFRALVGSHKAHPGTGRGRGAVARSAARDLA